MKKERTSIPTNTFWQYLPLLRELVVRDLKIKYRRSFLGYLWSLLNPLMMMTIMTIIFSYMFRFDIPNYPLYLICGQTMWSFFAESTNFAMHSVLGNGALIRKVYIPKYIFPISRVLSSFVTMSFSLIAIFIVLVFTGVTITWKIILIPIPLLLQLVFCMGVGMALSSMAVYFRDILHLYNVLVMAWMYATPIFYPMDLLPETLQWIVKRFNPMYFYVAQFRDLIYYGRLPGWGIITAGCVTALAMLGIGALCFNRSKDKFILYI